MARLFNYILGILTCGPIVMWLLSWVGIGIFGGLAGCRIDDAGTYPCEILGADLGGLAAYSGVFAAWGPVVLWPLVLSTGMLWALVAGMRMMTRTT